MLDTQYHHRELSMLAAQIDRCNIATLSERKEAENDALEAMRDLPALSRNLEWCLAGNYGYGAMVKMRQIAEAKRGNRPAQAVQLLMALDHFTPAKHTIMAWKRLTKDEQLALDLAVLSVLDGFESGE